VTGRAVGAKQRGSLSDSSERSRSAENNFQ
jgi:hypothetical protein